MTPAQAQTRFAAIQARTTTLFEQREFTKAAEELRAAICLLPSSAAAHQALGLAEAAAGNFGSALDSLRKASRLAPEDFAIWMARAQVEGSLGKWDDMGVSLLEAAQFDPHDGRAAATHAQLGRQLVARKQNDLALAELLRFRRSGGQDPEVLFLLARLENTLGAYADAAREGAALESGQSLPAQLRARGGAVAGLAYKNLDEPDKAIPHLKLAVELGEPADAAILETACLALAEIHQAKQDSAAARAALESGRRRLPGSARLALALGRNLAESGDAAAVPLLKEIIATSGDGEAYRWLAQAHTALGEFDLALGTLEQLVRRHPDYPMADVMIAQAALRLDPSDNARALRHLARAEKLSPSDPDIYYLRGKIQVTLGKYREAVESLRRAIALAPASDMAYYQLGLAYQRLGETALAKEQFDRMMFLRSR